MNPTELARVKEKWIAAKRQTSRRPISDLAAEHLWTKSAARRKCCRQVVAMLERVMDRKRAS